VRELLDGQPDPALYFARMKHINRDGAPILGRLPRPERLDAAALKAALERGAILIDSRPKERFRAGHTMGALSIPDASTFATRAAWFVGESARIVLAARPDRVEALTRALVRVGFDDVAGYVDEAVIEADRDLHSATLGYIDIEQLETQRRNSDGMILDVRNAHEYRSGHIPGALHVPASRLVGALDELPRDKPLYVHCAGGGRSSSAASSLLAHGFNDVFDVAGGFSAWQAMGKEVETGDPPRKTAAVGS
jgi:hydroxyacylglutathione hydrolase